MNIRDDYKKVKKLVSGFFSLISSPSGYLAFLSGILIILLSITLISDVSKEIFSSNPNYQYIINFAINGTIVSATLALLTFTYALVLEPPIKSEIIKIGEIFLMSTLLFIIGFIFLNSAKGILNDAETSIFPDLVGFSIILLFVSGILIQIASACYFAIGISKLLYKIITSR